VTEENQLVDRLWAYVHGELAPHERTALEQALRQDALLSRQVDSIRALHRALATSLSQSPEHSPETLTERVLAALPPLPEPAVVQVDSARPSRAARLLLRPLTYEVASLAAAAALIVAALPYRAAGPVAWTEALFSGATYRGQPSSFTPVEAAACLRTLKVAVFEGFRTLCAERIPARWGQRQDWNLAFSFEDLGGGRARIAITASDLTGAAIRRWECETNDPTAWRREAGALGRQIAAELSGRRSAASRSD